MKLVVDTSIIIDNLRGGELFDQLVNTLEGSSVEFFIPTVVIFEIFSGRSTRNSKEVKKIQALLANFTRVELNEDIAKRAGMLFRDNGSRIDVGDYVIAASAFEIGGQIITLNSKHFEQIPGILLYQFD